MNKDFEISKNCNIRDIREIAKKLNIDENDLEYYGKSKAKLNLNLGKKNGKLILVILVKLNILKLNTKAKDTKYKLGI